MIHVSQEDQELVVRDDPTNVTLQSGVTQWPLPGGGIRVAYAARIDGWASMPEENFVQNGVEVMGRRARKEVVSEIIGYLIHRKIEPKEQQNGFMFTLDFSREERSSGLFLATYLLITDIKGLGVGEMSTTDVIWVIARLNQLIMRIHDANLEHRQQQRANAPQAPRAPSAPQAPSAPRAPS